MRAGCNKMAATEYVFAVCRSGRGALILPAELVGDFKTGMDLAQQRTQETGLAYSCFPLPLPSDLSVERVRGVQ